MSIVMTNADKKFTNMKINEGDGKSLKSKFDDFINLSLNFYSINAHSFEGARKVVQDVIENYKAILSNLLDVYATCMDMQMALCEWDKSHPREPIIIMETFKNKNCFQEMKTLELPIDSKGRALQGELEKAQNAITTYLHDVGEMIYFTREDFVVVNLNWFCHNVMGHLINFRSHVAKIDSTTTFQNCFGTMKQIQYLFN
jgi:hypothetical protein